MMYRAWIRIEAIARIFGHADIRTTIRYLGLDFEDMSVAMQQYAEYQNTVVPQMVQCEESQKKGGTIGILNRESNWLTPQLYHKRYKTLVRGYEK